MKIPTVEEVTADPDNLAYYWWDHLNVDARLERLELKLDPNARLRFPAKLYRRDFPLAKGYKQEKSSRAVTFCRLCVIRELYPGYGITHNGQRLSVYYLFGWPKKMSNPYSKYRYTLRPAFNQPAFNTSYDACNQAALNEFEREVGGVVEALSTVEMKDLAAVYALVLQHTRGCDRFFSRDAGGVGEAASSVAPLLKKLPKHRMGRPIVRHSRVEYRGHRVS